MDAAQRNHARQLDQQEQLGPSLACDLPADDLADRADAWRALGKEALRRTAAPGRIVTLYPSTPAIVGRLAALVEAEARCCPFLEFDMRYRDDRIEVELRYPPEFEPVISTVLSDLPSRS